MKRIILAVLSIVVILLSITGCGISQDDYDELADKVSKLETQKAEQASMIESLTKQLIEVIPIYFENRTAIENWLKSVHNLGVSKDVTQWYQYAFYYQQKAIESGYIISVSYTVDEDEYVNITCDIVTQDGWIYYFDPDDLELHDTRIRVDMLKVSELEAVAVGIYQ